MFRRDAHERQRGCREVDLAGYRFDRLCFQIGSEKEPGYMEILHGDQFAPIGPGVMIRHHQKQSILPVSTRLCVTGIPPRDSTKVAPRLSSKMMTRLSGRSLSREATCKLRRGGSEAALSSLTQSLVSFSISSTDILP